MWSRAQLKQNAKRSLRPRYWNAFAVCFAWTVIFVYFYFYFYQGTFFYLTPGHGTQRPNIGFTYYFIIMIVFGVIALLQLFVKNPLLVGRNRFFMERRQGNAPFSTFLSGFTINWRNTVTVLLYCNCSVLLWSVVLIVPGIYRAYQYRLVPYLLAENPNLSSERAIALSKTVTQNEIVPMVLLDISFLGWFLLGLLPFGLGLPFVMPYYQATWAEFYSAMRAKLFALELTNESELSGFAQY